MLFNRVLYTIPASGGGAPQAITFVNASTEAAGSTSNPVNHTLNAPASPQVGDIWIAVIGRFDFAIEGQIFTPPADWNELIDAGFTNSPAFGVWWHRYEGVTPNLTWSSNSGDDVGGNWTGAIAAFRGCKASGSPINVTGAIRRVTAANNTISHTSITTTVAGCTLLLINVANDDTNRNNLTNYLPAFEDTNAGANNAYLNITGSVDGSISLMYRHNFPVAAGPTGTINQVMPASELWASVQIALEPVFA